MKLSTFIALKHVKNDSLVILDDSQLKDLQACILSVAEDVISFCEKHDIAYNLGGGSALGAVRHKGFIPWDDDIDIDMPRVDFERFKVLFSKEMGDKYWLHVPGETDNYGMIIGHVRKKGTRLRGHSDFEDECGVFIDIFIKENTYDNFLLRLLHGIGSQFYGLIVSCSRFYVLKDQYIALANADPALLRTVRVKAAIGALFSWKSVKDWAKAADTWNSKCKNTLSQYVTVPGGRHHYFGEMRPRDMFGQGTPMLFEGHSWLVPEQYESYLIDHFGLDYMQVPQEAQREKHAYLEFDLGITSDGDDKETSCI